MQSPPPARSAAPSTCSYRDWPRVGLGEIGTVICCHPPKVEAGKVTETVHLIDWAEPRNNDFALAKEVTLKGNHERRPDLVLYVNGIAVAVVELKNCAGLKRLRCDAATASRCQSPRAR